MSKEKPSPLTPAAGSATLESPPQLFLFPAHEVSGYSLLTDRQRKFAEGVLSGMSDCSAALRAGYSKSTARVRASELRKNVGVQGFLNQAWLKSGETPDSFIARIAERAQAAHAYAMSLPRGSKSWRAAMSAARDEDALLATIHGKLKINVEHSGSVSIEYNESIRLEIVEAVKSCVQARGEAELSS